MSSATELAVTPYEDRLKLDRSWSMAEADRQFQRRDQVFRTLGRIARELETQGIPHAVAGALALHAHGFRRLTDNIDLLLTPRGFAAVHGQPQTFGLFAPPLTNSNKKNLRDTDSGVLIRFLISGDYPGDGKPRPVAFPDPSETSSEIDGIRYLTLPALVELKLASGMTGGLHRLKDITDVIALIETLELPRDLAESLNPYVRDKYLELWNDLQEPPREP